MSVRKARHAGTWYSDSEVQLSSQLDSWLHKVDLDHSPARAIITPHAGYRYCGSTAAFAYRQINPSQVRRIFILGPSHHYSISGCALTSAQKYQTPLYDLTIDTQTNSELHATGQFEWLDLDVDEREHSIEMQLPYVAKIMEKNREFTIVPIFVGTLSQDKQQLYGRIFAAFLKDPQNVIIISSDFCHWGSQFRYTYYDNTYANIYESVEHLDRIGMDAIEKLSFSSFADYLKKYGNTICGRHVIGILLNSIQQLRGYKSNLKFLKYSQSNKCLTMNDSSVSYAAASLTIQ